MEGSRKLFLVARCTSLDAQFSVPYSQFYVGCVRVVTEAWSHNAPSLGVLLTNDVPPQFSNHPNFGGMSIVPSTCSGISIPIYGCSAKSPPSINTHLPHVPPWMVSLLWRLGTQKLVDSGHCIEKSILRGDFTINFVPRSCSRYTINLHYAETCVTSILFIG